jgi:ABC-type Fe3+ transport system substrate-binding protein
LDTADLSEAAGQSVVAAVGDSDEVPVAVVDLHRRSDPQSVKPGGDATMLVVDGPTPGPPSVTTAVPHSGCVTNVPGTQIVKHAPSQAP